MQASPPPGSCWWIWPNLNSSQLLNPKMVDDSVQLAPSMLAADFARLGDQVAQAEQAGANRMHVDVMDGYFVPTVCVPL